VNIRIGKLKTKIFKVNKENKMKCRCPKCGSSNVGQYRCMTGPIWCEDCGYRIEQKELNNGSKKFFVKEDSDKKRKRVVVK